MNGAVSHVTFTRFNDLAGASKKEFRTTWTDFICVVENADQYDCKAACPLIKLATFGEQRTANNSLRHDANVLTVSGLEGDYDGEVVTIDEAAEKLVFAGVTAMFYSSPSHSDDKPRWRVVCPLSREYPPAERRRFVARLNGVLGGILAPESFALSQVYYIGRVNGSPYATRSVDGLCIDVIDELDGIAIDNAPKEGKPRSEKAREARDADPVIARLRERGMVKRDRQDGGVDIVCPFESSHTAPSGDGATTYFAAHTGGFARGHFVCKHSHCARRTDADFLAALGLAYEQAQPKADSPVDPEVAKLAALPPLEYDRVRKDKAIELGVRPGALDEEMKRQRKQEKAKKQKAARDGNGAAGAAILDSTTDTLLDLNQDNVALVFTRRYANQFRYSHDRKQWYSWDGTRWREETTRLAFDYTRNLSRTLNTDGKREVSRSSFCEGVEKYAQSDRVFALRGEEWDQNSWLLNTPGGTVDLLTGKMRKHAPSDLVTRITSVAPKRGNAPLWFDFLKQVTNENTELVEFLQRMVGYCLTGDTREECLFFLYGEGGNGKGTFVGALSAILSDFAKDAAMDTFLASQHERHSTDLAMLRGARLVTASETERGRSWNEQRVKALTGRDRITCRFMRQDNFTYTPQFKLLLLGNNKPTLHSVDAAWRRRFHIVPFNYTPPKADLTLKDRLVNEYPQILNWMIDGCIKWRASGLKVPEVVLNETDEYFAAQDTFSEWLETCCELKKTFVDTSSRLFKSWKAFAENAGESPGTSKSLADRLQSRGMKRLRNVPLMGGRGFQGLQIRQ